MLQSSLAEIKPYLHPGYWDGYRPGEMAAELTPLPVSGMAAEQAARRALGAYLARFHTYFPQQAYRTGDVFDGGAHALGTVVLLHHELLWTRGKAPQVTFAPRERPAERTTAIDTSNLPEIAFGRVLYWNGVWYRGATRWGLLMENNQSHRLLAVGSRSSTFRDRTGPPVVVGLARLPAVLTIGRTFHTRSYNVHRVNALQIVGQGLPEYQRRRFWEFLGHLLPRPSEA